MSHWYSLHLILIQQILIYGLLALGVQSAFIAGIFSLASVGFFAVGAFVTGALVSPAHGHMNPILAVAIVVVVTIVIAYVFAQILRGLNGLYLGMATFAFDFIVASVANNFFTAYTGGPLGIYGIPNDINTPEIVIVLLVFVGIASWVERRSAGRATRAIRLDTLMARSVGVDVRQWQTIAFVLSSVCGAVAGGMYILAFGTISPADVGFDFISLILTMVVIGGRDSWLGAILGAAILMWLPTVLTEAQQWRPLVYGAAIVLVATYAPGGILGVGRSAFRLISSRIRSGSGSGSEPHDPAPGGRRFAQFGRRRRTGELAPGTAVGGSMQCDSGQLNSAEF